MKNKRKYLIIASIVLIILSALLLFHDFTEKSEFMYGSVLAHLGLLFIGIFYCESQKERKGVIVNIFYPVNIAI